MTTPTSQVCVCLQESYQRYVRKRRAAPHGEPLYQSVGSSWKLRCSLRRRRTIQDFGCSRDLLKVGEVFGTEHLAQYSIMAGVRGDNQDERAASIRMRMRRGGLTEGWRSPTDWQFTPAGSSEPVWQS